MNQTQKQKAIKLLKKMDMQIKLLMVDTPSREILLGLNNQALATLESEPAGVCQTFDEWFEENYPLPSTVERGPVGREMKEACRKAWSVAKNG